MDWKRGAENIRLFSPGFAAGEATFREACFFFAGDTTVAVVFEQRGGSPTTRGVLFLNQPPSGLLTLLLRISLGRVVGIGTPRSWRTSSIILCRADFDLRRLLFVFVFCFFSFFLSFLVGYRLIILLRYIFFFLQTFLVEEELESMRCELDRSRFHVSFNVFRAVRVIDDL